ncbi:MAG: hypothetical protein ISR59_12700 [Anaerolineales bacterium]|uniref:Uncharacterized protein n=1 Tax=Candidatus Desulfolinea nitratireducens TaxID=2841698 RepID=A0A8J6TIX3_9CHLR|nr:hypothetical protein [Candidatus Desulfolinea nitratireducens]MBL6961958.1 hypothetical protein [Anaerolineales bacterium]
MSKSNVKAKPGAKTNWSAGIIIGLGISILLIGSGIVKMLVSESHGVVDVTTGRTVFLFGLYLALPWGLLSLIAGIKAKVKKMVAITGIIFGVVSILFGLISWIWFFMVSPFASAFS